ncbi:nucleotidyltransferase [Dissulfurispira thermophila]|uniref:Nucleotidyltransferase n=2 Tax=root TaxID=1 RepID=A0A7G1H000_9BACT|nr:nucleotidyltransferase domain-containing protein [Dissulfurispira thermophila]BCB95589.1 nucleotidyltransferase [Dissulfurispira thermophila]
MIRFKKLPDDIKERIERLRDFLFGHPEIIFAYFFGGLAKEGHSPLSDVDIAIYVKNPRRFDYLRFYSEITDFLGTEEVDLVVLNSAPITLSGRILQSKKILIDKEPFLRHKFESLVIRKFLDFQYREKQIFKERFRID